MPWPGAYKPCNSGNDGTSGPTDQPVLAALLKNPSRAQAVPRTDFAQVPRRLQEGAELTWVGSETPKGTGDESGWARINYNS